MKELNNFVLNVQKFKVLNLKNIYNVQDTVQKMCVNVTH